MYKENGRGPPEGKKNCCANSIKNIFRKRFHCGSVGKISTGFAMSFTKSITKYH